MENDVTRQEFELEGEAIAFVEGLNTAITLLDRAGLFRDSDHLIYEGPFVEGDKWIVEVWVVA